MQVLSIVLAQATRLVIDNDLQSGNFLGKGPDLVDLLLILNHREADLGVVKNISHLFCDRVSIDGYRNGADRLGSGEAPIKAGTVRADYRDLVAARQPKVREADR